MSNSEQELDQITPSAGMAKLPLAAAIVALVGLADAVYLTAQHYTGEKVPCSVISGCEQVLTSSYAEMFGIPTAAFGAVAYFVAFSLAILAVYGNRRMWTFYGVLTAAMTIFTLWLIYLQAFVIKAFCQFCLISAASTLTLFILYLVSRFRRSP